MNHQLPARPAGSYQPTRLIHNPALPYHPQSLPKPPPYSLPAVNIVIHDSQGRMTVKPMYISYDITGEQFLRGLLGFHSSTRTKIILHKILDLLLMRRTIITSIKVTMTDDRHRSSTPVSVSAPVLLLENHHVHELLTTALNNPSRIRHISNFAHTVLLPYFMSHGRLSEVPNSCHALMLDHTLCLRKQIIWLVAAVGASLIAGWRAGGLATGDWDLDLALAVGGVIFAVLSTVQMALTRVYQSRDI